MTIPGGIPSGPQLGTEILDKIFQASQESWKSDSPEKATSDEKILEKHGGTQKTKTDNTGKPIKYDKFKSSRRDSIITSKGSKVDTMLVWYIDDPKHDTSVWVRWNNPTVEDPKPSFYHVEDK